MSKSPNKYNELIKGIFDEFNQERIRVFPLESYLISIPFIISICEEKKHFSNILANYLNVLNQKLDISKINKRFKLTLFNIMDIMKQSLFTENKVDFSLKSSNKLLLNFIIFLSNLFDK